ncbi:MAG TPA: diguanylate cyclase [Gaiellaceae bacterium]
MTQGRTARLLRFPGSGGARLDRDRRNRSATRLRAEDGPGSFERLADVFHDLLSEQSLDDLLDRIFDAVSELVPCDSLTVLRTDEPRQMLVPVLARDRWAEELMAYELPFGTGLTGWAIEHNEPVLSNAAHVDPRTQVVPGTPPDEPEALIVVPLVARGTVKGSLNVYRLGPGASFTEDEFELVKRCADAAALALDNAEIRARLEQQAQSDALTGLWNHSFFHDRIRAELTRASRAHDSVAVAMLDIDDFKKVNDVHGHGTGDQVLAGLADVLRASVRGSDVVCRIGGEEFAVIMPSSNTSAGVGLVQRITEQLEQTEFEGAGQITVSVGIAAGPIDASNPRELVAFAEAAMMTAKTRGKNQTVVFSDLTEGRPDVVSTTRDVRSTAHLKMLQSLAGKLNRLNDVTRIGEVIVNELRSLLDYHACRVYVREGIDDLVPVAFKGDLGEYGEETFESLRCKVGEGITGSVAVTGEPLLIENALECEFAVTIPGTDDIEESMVAVPLRYGSRVIGVVVLSKLGIGEFDADDVRLLEVLAGHASVAIENARLYEAQRREAESARESADISNALLELSRELAEAEELDAVLDQLVALTTKITGCARSSVWFQEPGSGDIAFRAAWGYDEQGLERLRGIRVPTYAAARFLGHDRSFVATPSDLAGIRRATEPDDGRRYAVAPIPLELDRKGFLVAVVADADHQDPPERTMLLLDGIAHQAKLAIADAVSFENLEQTFLSTVEALANALEARDEYTSSHARAITDMALLIGEQLGLDPAGLKRLELGALFHDIGKIGIPSDILLKPGPLTHEERAVMEQHPELGERIIAPIVRLSEVRPIVRHCHERFDGDGYPDGRAGEGIPIESRIILVCDAFHAMTTDRPYRGRLPVEEACTRLRENAGSQFDPRVVDVFLHLFESAAV